MIMLKSYFKILIRGLLKKKLFSILNMSGLALGMTCYLVIFQYVSFELSYDGFHENKNDIYRMQRDIYENNDLKSSLAKTSYNLGPGLKEEFPEVREVTRCSPLPDTTVICHEEKYPDEKIYIAESSFFKVFSFRLLKGDPDTSLKEPNKVVISRGIARKYFGGENPVGKVIRITNKGVDFACMVTGVFKDVPENSHLKFDILLSLATVWKKNRSDWVYSVFYTYVLLGPDADSKALEAKFPQFINKHILKHVPRASNWKLLLQPLRDIYLYSDLTYDTKNGDGKIVYFLLIIAFLILVISWINYVNLSTARAMERAREVGLRKVLGSHRIQLIKQFLLESLLTNIIPVVIAVILTIIFMPFLRELTGKGVPLYLASAPLFWLHVLGLYTAASLLAGLYPAFVLSSFKPVSILNRSKFSQTTGGTLLRKFLVTFQFAAAAVLIIFTFSVYKQIQYMRNKDLGITIDHILGIRLPATPVNKAYINNVDTLKNELLRYPGIERITGSTVIPGTIPRLRRLTWKENTDFKAGKVQSIVFMDYDFLPTYQLELLAGRNFSRDYGTDNKAVIINEISLKFFGFPDPASALDQNISIWNIPGKWKVVGVIKNYHHRSLKKSHEPYIFILRPSLKNYYSLKLNPANTGETLALVKGKWAEIFPGDPLDYFFLDDHFNLQYQSDRHFGKVLGIFVILALIITCLGLLSLSYFSTLQRTREIGIRKSFGAGIGDILLLLTKDIVKLVVIAAVAAWPIAYYIIDNWLKNYAFRISVPLLFFLVSGLLLILVSVATVASHTFTAALANPVNVLRED